MFKCPYCGGELKIVGVQRGINRLRQDSSTAFKMAAWSGDGADTLMRQTGPEIQSPPSASGLYGIFQRLKHPSNSAQPLKPRLISTHQQPARAPSVEADVRVPLFQSFVTGTLSCACVAGAWLVMGWQKPGLATAASFLVATTTDWLHGRGELRDLMWRIEEFFDHDLDQDGAVGPSAPPAGPTSRIIIRPRHQVPASWSELPAEAQTKDIYFFAQTVWGRQQVNLANGQKALRGLALPSGFEITDSLHAELLGLLDQAGVIRKKGSAWELAAPPAAVRDMVRAEEWP